MTNAAQQKDARRRSNNTTDQSGRNKGLSHHAKNREAARRRISQNSDNTNIQQTTKSKTTSNQQNSHYQLKELINKTMENLACKIKNCKDDKGIITEAVDYDSTSPNGTPLKKKDSLKSKGFKRSLKKDLSISSTVYSNAPLQRETSVTSTATYCTTHRDSLGSTGTAYTGPLKWGSCITSTTANSASLKNESSASIPIVGSYNTPLNTDNSVVTVPTPWASYVPHKKINSTAIPSVNALQKKESLIYIDNNDKDTTGQDVNSGNQEDPDSGPSTLASQLSSGAVYVSTSF